jgi:hypothetical protein
MSWDVAIHDAARNGRVAGHDAVVIVGWMIHDAAGIVRSMIHDAAGGLTPTPDEPPHGSINLWGFATSRGSMGDDRGVEARRPRHHPMMSRWWQDPINGPCRASQGWCLGPPIVGGPTTADPHRRRPHDRPIPAASWTFDRRTPPHRAPSTARFSPRRAPPRPAADRDRSRSILTG